MGLYSMTDTYRAKRGGGGGVDPIEYVTLRRKQ